MRCWSAGVAKTPNGSTNVGGSSFQWCPCSSGEHVLSTRTPEYDLFLIYLQALITSI